MSNTGTGLFVSVACCLLIAEGSGLQEAATIVKVPVSRGNTVGCFLGGHLTVIVEMTRLGSSSWIRSHRNVPAVRRELVADIIPVKIEHFLGKFVTQIKRPGGP